MKKNNCKPGKSIVYEKETLNFPAFPLGGIGAGMICLEGTGNLSHFSLRNKPEVFNEPTVFSAISLKGNKQSALLLEGPVQSRKIFGSNGTGNGYISDRSNGLPRFENCSFQAEFPFGTVRLKDKSMPFDVEITGWSPFIPNDADNSSLPVAALEYSFKNNSDKTVEAVYSFNSVNFMKCGNGINRVAKTEKGFVFIQQGTPEEPWEEGYFCAQTTDKAAKVNPSWFRGGWYDSLTMAWNDIASGNCPEKENIPENEDSSPGASLFVPFKLKEGESKKITVQLSWYVPKTNVRVAASCQCKSAGPAKYHSPWYSGKFKNIEETAAYWKKNHDKLKEKTLKFSTCLYDTNLPGEVTDAVTTNLTILKSPTVLRQTDGRLWCWEGCCDGSGCCSGSCTHVWNYAQAIPHLFPELERSLRQTEFNECQDERGHQNFRSFLPIEPTTHDKYAAADGQLGGIMKIYRDWKVSGNTSWLNNLWPLVKKSLDYCIETWDPDHKGVLIEPHHNTYDIEFWGADGMCSSFYLGALKAAMLMAEELKDEVPLYEELYTKGRKYLETRLFNGEYFEQHIQWKNLKAGNPVDFKCIVNTNKYSPEAMEILKKEGPKYQYGKGCLSDGVLGAWMAEVCGVGEILDKAKVKSHLKSVYKYNFRKDLSKHANPQRYTYANGKEGGLLLCSWPHGEKPRLPMPYSEEAWTGIEYQVAAHLIMTDCIKEGTEIVKTCRKRYDGKIRNPFDEYECGHWYGRALSSYSLLQAFSGIRYNAVNKTLYVKKGIKGNYKTFICTASGYGTVEIKNGKPFIEVAEGKIEISKITEE